jgi:aminoglycoside phosphotransferase (APT) family kinase protein
MGRTPVDADALASVAARHLGAGVTIEGLRRLSGGASRETWTFDARRPDGHAEALVLRRDPGGHALGSSDRATEYELLRAAGAAGVPVPAVRFLLEPGDGLGDGFVMDRVDGETIPRKILRDDAYAGALGRLAAQCGEIAARIHAVDPATLPAMPVQTASQQVAQYRSIIDGFGEPHPVFELALRWLEAEQPATGGAPRLVHGDFRNGNFIVGPEGIRSVLDWELAHLGDPVEDLGWLCVRSWRFGHDDRPVGGFGDLSQLLDAYEGAGGGRVDPSHVRYWEVFGTLKWGVICEVQSFTHLHGMVRSVELAALGRRVAETEWDLLELVG